MRFILPWPPSANAIWRNDKGHTHLSKPYKAFLNEAIQTIRFAMKQRRLPVINEMNPDSIRVRIILFPPDYRPFDVDNRIKPLLDAITKSGYWFDDSCVDWVEAIRGLPTEGGRVYIEIFTVEKTVSPARYGLPIKWPKTKKLKQKIMKLLGVIE